MIYQALSRNQKAKGWFKAKHALQIILLLIICTWFFYQIKNFSMERKVNDGSVDLGRKGNVGYDDDGDDKDLLGGNATLQPRKAEVNEEEESSQYEDSDEKVLGLAVKESKVLENSPAQSTVAEKKTADTEEKDDQSDDMVEGSSDNGENTASVDSKTDQRESDDFEDEDGSPPGLEFEYAATNETRSDDSPAMAVDEAAVLGSDNSFELDTDLDTKAFSENSTQTNNQTDSEQLLGDDSVLGLLEFLSGGDSSDASRDKSSTTNSQKVDTYNVDTSDEDDYKLENADKSSFNGTIETQDQNLNLDDSESFLSQHEVENISE